MFTSILLVLLLINCFIPKWNFINTMTGVSMNYK